MLTKVDQANWIYWELGLLTAMLAMAVTPADGASHLSYGLVSMLFLWGLVRS